MPLENFHPISLKEMDAVKLMNRTDTKFVFSVKYLHEILEDVSNRYFVLQIKSERLASYETLYFDTPDFKNYITHHNGKLNRFKVRIRHYVNSGSYFLEEKFKNNKGRTLKKRIETSKFHTTFSKKEKMVIQQNTTLNPDELEPKLINHFQRITLVQPDNKERITIDINLGFSNNNHKDIQLQNIVIAEVKKNSRTQSIMEQLFHSKHILPAGFSKYCTGIALLNPKIKQNRFKYKLLQIKKIEYGTV